MYNFITVTDSDEKTEVIFAYSEPKDNIRKETFIFQKAYKSYSRIQITTSGTEKCEYIEENAFFWAYGAALGQMSCGVPK